MIKSCQSIGSVNFGLDGKMPSATLSSRITPTAFLPIEKLYSSICHLDQDSQRRHKPCFMKGLLVIFSMFNFTYMAPRPVQLTIKLLVSIYPVTLLMNHLSSR